MSPASYRTAPPRVGQPNVTGRVTCVQIGAVSTGSTTGYLSVAALLRGGLVGEGDGAVDQGLSLVDVLGVGLEVAVLERLGGGGELVVGLLQQLEGVAGDAGAGLGAARAGIGARGGRR